MFASNLVAVLRPRRGPAVVEHVRGDRPMPFATAHTVSLNEARDRCRLAILNSNPGPPATRRVTVLMSQAVLLKRGTHFIRRSPASHIASGFLPHIGDVETFGHVRTRDVHTVIPQLRSWGTSAANCPILGLLWRAN